MGGEAKSIIVTRTMIPNNQLLKQVNLSTQHRYMDSSYESSYGGGFNGGTEIGFTGGFSGGDVKKGEKVYIFKATLIAFPDPRVLLLGTRQTSIKIVI